jgi:GDSL-like Lipase/Acylhydrolase family
VLLGDSIFDNAAHFGGGPDVVRQLRAALPPGWRATLNAVNGAVVGSIADQLARLPADASHLVLSAGGNDALAEAELLHHPAASVLDALEKLAAVRERFARDYRVVLAEVLGRKLPTAICTIYEPRYPDPGFNRIAGAALALINDVITREGFARHATVIDLRILCASDEDFANPIEPSVIGGAKIAAAIANFAVPDGSPRSQVIVR